MLQGTKALETWCCLVTEGYTNVNIVNMSSSWRNGMAFCAIIHKFRPELINFDLLEPDDAFGNNELAFTTAEQHLGIPALLDPQDMVECEVLDRLSILTYLSQFYQTFHGATGPCKESTPTKLRYVAGSTCSSGSSTPSKSRPANVAMLPGKRSEPCKICGKPVFILERLHVSGRLLHRTCFKCARCGHQLSIANYYETESGSYCCEVCPDEEVNQTEVAKANMKIVESKNQDLDEASEAADEINSLPESQRLSNNNIVEALDQDNNVTVIVEDINIVKNTEESLEKESKVEQEIVNDEAKVVEPDENIAEVDDFPQEQVEADQDNNETDEKDHDNIIDEEEKHANEIEDEEGDSPVPLPECDQHDEIIDNQKQKDDDKETIEAKADEVEAAEADADKEMDVENCNTLEREEVSYPEDLNPFGSEEEGDDDEEDENEELNNPQLKKESTNPFGSDSDTIEEKEEEKDNDNRKPSPQPSIHLQSPPKPPRLSLNPFGSDFEDDDDNDENGANKSVPESKKTAPSRKKRHAPPPPTMTSSPIPSVRTSLLRSAPPRPPPPAVSPCPGGKTQKDEDNLSRRSQILEESTTEAADEIATPTSAQSLTILTPMSPNKANEEGQWKKKKGPAPPRPIPPKRQVKKLPRKAVNVELVDIEIKQLELERQGVDLEKMIREVCEISDKEREEAGLDNNDRDSLGPQAEDLIVQLFELVNEKNELFRRQTELMYMKREHRLEEEHADIEHQIRVLMAKPDALRTDEDKILEDKLISRLMAIVSQRNEIVDCLEMDRLRELEEDESIEIHLGEYAAIKPQDEEEMLKKKKDKKKKEKKKKKKDKDYDADKDIDTSEFPSAGASLSSSPRPSPKKSPLGFSDKDKAKKLKKKLMSTLKPISMKR